MRVINREGIRVAGVAALTLMVVGCTGGEASEGPAATTGRIVSVEVVEVRTEPFTDYVQVVGTVEPNQDVTLSAEESGTIRVLEVEKGTYVRAGQAIARIDDRVLRPQVEQAEAEAALARETWERQRRLWEEDRVGSEIAYLQARYRAETADAGARALRERLERTVVRAPISGVLDARLVEIGTLVSPGTPVGRVIDNAIVKITGGVPERFAGQIRRGTSVDVRIDGVEGASFSGTVAYVGTSVESASRTFPIEVRVENPGTTLKPGMIASIRLARQTTENAVVVPQEAVLRVEDGYLVYLASEREGELRAEGRRVELGTSQGNRVVIDAGLEPGEQLVVVGQSRLAPGDRLQIVQSIAGRTR